MKEIKFQIYWIAGHEMLYDTNNDLEFRDKENYWITDLSDATNHPESYKVRRYTGLKDKNGAEIYEGDIIGLDGFWSYCIDLHDGAFRKIPCNQAQKLNWPWNPLEKVTIEVHGWEVIGNRYENQEMLEETKC